MRRFEPTTFKMICLHPKNHDSADDSTCLVYLSFTTVKLCYNDHGYNDHGHNDHGYNDHGYNEFTAITNKIRGYFWFNMATLLHNPSRS